jgi:hypothetical protein
MTKDEILNDFTALEKSLDRENELRAVYAGQWIDQQAQEITNIAATVETIVEKYRLILAELNISQDMDSNSVYDFIDFAHELFKQAENDVIKRVG